MLLCKAKTALYRLRYSLTICMTDTTIRGAPVLDIALPDIATCGHVTQKRFSNLLLRHGLHEPSS